MIRLATPADLGVVTAVTAAAYAVYTPLLGAPPLPVTEDHAPRIAAGEVWLLEHEGSPAGLLELERHHDHALIYSVAVDPVYHGKGLGSLLLDFAETTARGWHVPALRLYTNAKMTRNLALYASRGFRETGRRGHPLRPNFTLVDMKKPLVPVVTVPK